MAVPKRKTSKQRKRQRRTHYKADAVAVYTVGHGRLPGTHTGADYWPHGYEKLNVPLATLNTFVLIASSVTMVMAWASLRLNDFKKQFVAKIGS